MKSKVYIISVIFLLILCSANSSNGYQWEKTFGGPFSDFGRSVQQTTDGGYIITGYTRSSANPDLYLIKTDAGGKQQWSEAFGTSGEDWGEQVRQTTDGGYIVAGYYWSFDPTDWYIWLMKTDATGKQLWSKTFERGWEETVNSLEQTTDGGYIIGGFVWNTFITNYQQVWVIKTDANGNEQWNKAFGGSDRAYDGGFVQQTADGGYIIAGTYYEYGYGHHIFLIKTDANGNEQWNKAFGESDISNREVSVQQTADGGYIVVASTSLPDSDVYLIKTDASGDQQWSKTFGGGNDDFGYSVQQTTDGGYIVAGETRSFGAGNSDVYLIYYNPSEFVDVPPGYWAGEFINKIYENGITSGCSQNPPMYCPEDPVTRAQMAVFLERGINGSDYSPPDATGIFDDCPVSYWAADWVEQFYADGITSGCSTDPPLYCPDDLVTRAQMAVFLLRSMYGNGYTPPSAVGIFDDVPVTHWAADWVEQLYDEGISGGCSTNPPLYCPDEIVNRAQMAVFIVRAFDL